MQLKALIFDVDGTLAETERDGHRPAFNAAFWEAGLRWRWDEQLYGELLAVAGGKERMRHYAQHCDPAFFARRDREEAIQAMHSAKTRHYLDILEAGDIPLRPGIADLVAEARAAGLRLAIATTTTLDNVLALLRTRLGPESIDWFDAIGTGDIVPAKKPAPDIYLWVLDRLELPAADCLALEDSALGLRSALAAGIPVVATESMYTRGQDFTGARAVLPDLSDTRLSDIRLMHRIRSS
ncbi:MAG: HAD family hydrolase [Candidatus Nitricoxidivorans perseverans]|uniref:HAD family hydrolase n=1 Tax=Candidatus Nitricoxidivorans perseverans TaxID=2975601 RepID=A0AA49FN52_9PROT|nr:MAG: HAD family hydrolase [Candidatus Nitricoxidivorans perseverans]